METCIFCKPEDFGIRKLKFEDKSGYWYVVVPEEIGAYGQILMVVKKREEDKRHITNITDPELLNNEERLLSIIKGIHVISSKLRKHWTDQEGRKIEKTYVLTQCEGENTHLHFQFLPRFEDDSTGNEFLYACELEEARWQNSQRLPPRQRIERGKQIIGKYESLLEQKSFSHPKRLKSRILKEVVERLNQILKQDEQTD